MDITIVNSVSIVNNNWILKPNYHMNFGKKRIEKAVVKQQKFDTLGNVTSSIFTGGIFKRFFVDKEEFGFPYISAQHMMNSNPLDVAKCISKKYTPKLEEMTLKENQILVSCAGTVGNVKLITRDLTNVVGSQDIIRVNADNSNIPYGYLYAYLSSKTAYNYMQSFIYGSVVPRIEPNTLAKLPIPIIEESKQQEIHNLIVESSNLRVQANELLQNTIDFFNEKYKLQEVPKVNRINIKQIVSGDKYTKESRFEADFYNLSTVKLRNLILEEGGFFLGDIANEINRSGLRERKFVKNNGIPLITGQDLNQAYLKDLKQLSKRFTRNIEKNLTKNKDILVSVQGTIGRCEYVLDNQYLNVFASEQLSKIKINEKLIHPGYVFAFLKSIPGQVQLKKFKTGSIIEWIKENNIASIIIPKPIDNGKEIGGIIDKYACIQNLSVVKENQAIDLIEKEIDAWQ